MAFLMAYNMGGDAITDSQKSCPTSAGAFDEALALAKALSTRRRSFSRPSSSPFRKIGGSRNGFS